MSEKLDRCVVLAEENKGRFEVLMEQHLEVGYKVEASSCNSKEYKAILILPEENTTVRTISLEPRRKLAGLRSTEIIYECDCCGYELGEFGQYSYCPNCGQKQDWR